ncbi:MAG: Mth938-like domain-containing protein [Candidatus Thiodiazotropha sp.]
MKFILDEPGGGYAIQHYANGKITVNGIIYRENLLVMPNQVIPQWRPASFDDLTPEDFVQLAKLGSEIVILGTGSKQRFPTPALTYPLFDARIGLEVMDTAAACRTFNILMSEGRQVAAALFTINP